MPVTRSYHRLGLALLALLLSSAIAQNALAQSAAPDFPDFGGGFGDSGFGDSGFGKSNASKEVAVEAQFSQSTEEQPARLFITAKIAPNYHIYALDQGALPNGGGGPQPTYIKVAETKQFRITVPFKPIKAPTVRIDTVIWEGLAIREHGEQVTWYAPIEFASGVDISNVQIDGEVSLQACDEDTCIPFNLKFTATQGEGFEVPTETTSIAAPETTETALPLITMLGYGLIGGLILNLMPCVLPVIGLKVMSFAKQGGESRAHILLLNLAYAAGLLAVFMILAGLASLVQLGLSDQSYGWGELYTFTWFKVSMTGFVFAMALSFLGIWELPIPGFATTGKATELTAKEGPSGAFFMGMFTTILATPCSGPFLGPVFGYTIAQPPAIIFAIFASVGIGMALPYLLIGLFPSLVSWIPKPGAWMDTFKNLMGFVLLGTVVYLFSTMNSIYFLPTLTLCVGIWFACWWIGRTPLTATQGKRSTAWVGGFGTAALIGFLAFKLLTPSTNQLPWQPFAPETLAAARAEGKTVLVDFTANWCPTCKTNLKFAINREEVLEKVQEYNVVTLIADWTDRNDTIKSALEELNSISIPLMAIYPAGEEQPIVLPDLLTKDRVLTALEEAGPSLDTESKTQVLGRKSTRTTQAALR